MKLRKVWKIEMWVPMERIGAVIGPKGSIIKTLNDISRTSIMIHLDRTQDKCKLLSIVGGDEECDFARKSITDILDRSANKKMKTSKKDKKAKRNANNTQPSNNYAYSNNNMKQVQVQHRQQHNNGNGNGNENGNRALGDGEEDFNHRMEKRIRTSYEFI